MVNRVISLKTETRLLNSSINLSRNSDFKQMVNKNLFEINEEWENLESTNKVNNNNGQEENDFSLREAYNDDLLQVEFFKKRDKH